MPSPQNDHLATDRQAEAPAEQSQGVPPEIHTAVFLNFHISTTTTKTKQTKTKKLSQSEFICH